MAGSKNAAERIFSEISFIPDHYHDHHFLLYIFSGIAVPSRFSRRIILFLLRKSIAMAYNLLKGKKGFIFGALDENSIAWKTALRCHEEGAQIVLTNAPVALRMGEINTLAATCGNAPVIGADVTNMDDLKNLFEKSMEHFGGKIDF